LDCDSELIIGQEMCPACGSDVTYFRVSPPHVGRLHDVIFEDPLSQLNAPEPLLLKGSDSVEHAVGVMRKHRFGSVLIVDEESKLQGIFTERDLLNVPAPGPSLKSVSLESVMTPKPKALREDDTIALALNRMAVGGYRHIPIVRDGVPVGFTSIRGILTYLGMNGL